MSALFALIIENPYRNQDDVDFSDIVVTENLIISGLTYLPGTTRFVATNIAPPPLVEPVVSGANGSVLTWTLSDQYVMDAPNGGFGNQPALAIEFDVRRHATVTEEGLVGANRTIEAAVSFTPSCDTGYRHTSTTGPGHPAAPRTAAADHQDRPQPRRRPGIGQLLGPDVRSRE